MKHLYYDKRLVDYYIKKGKITKEDLDKYLNELPDEKDKAEFIDLDKLYEEVISNTKAD